jgi:hypothetical protein
MEAGMVKVVAALVLVLLFVAQGVLAQEPKDPLDEAMQKNPARFEADMVDLVVGYGGAEGLTLAAIEDYIALERAGARASALRRLFAMDLNGDGAVDRQEVAVIQRAASAASRGRIERQFAGADADSSGRVDAAEIAADGQAAAMRALGEGEATMLRSLLRLDADANGALTVQEVGSAVMRLDQDS